MKETD